jgi:protein-histidine pros-kinase
MLSSLDRPSGRVDLGVDAYLMKPVLRDDLADAMSQVLGTSLAKSRGNAIAESATSANSPSGTGSAAEMHPAASGTGLRILLAEDNLVNQRLMCTMLRKRGHQVTLAENGEQVLANLNSGMFDLILMDVQMPVMGGMEATAAIRSGERESQCHMPIIALTAHAMQGDKQRCLEAGMDAYLSKPVQQKELFDCIDELVGIHVA